MKNCGCRPQNPPKKNVTPCLVCACLSVICLSLARGKGGEVDVPLNYADYYFLESLMRFRNLSGGRSVLGR